MRRNLPRAMVSSAGACSLAAALSCTGQIGPSPSDSAGGARPGTNPPPRTGSPPGPPGLDPSSNGGPGASTTSDPGSTPGSDPSADPSSDPSANPADAPLDTSKCAPPPGRVVRLSKLEIQNSVTDLLATKRVLELPDDAKFLNFSSNAEDLEMG